MDIIMNYLLNNNYITKNNKNFIKYGIEVFILNNLSIMSILLVSFVTNKIIIGISFIINFIVIRTNLGGFHCKKPLNCILMFPLLYFNLIYIFKVVHIDILILFSLIILNFMLFLKPIKNNCYLKEYDYIRCKNFLNIILIFYILINVYSLIWTSNVLILRGIDYAVIFSFFLYCIELIIKSGSKVF